MRRGDPPNEVLPPEMLTERADVCQCESTQLPVFSDDFFSGSIHCSIDHPSLAAWLLPPHLDHSVIFGQVWPASSRIAFTEAPSSLQHTSSFDTVVPPNKLILKGEAREVSTRSRPRWGGRAG